MKRAGGWIWQSANCRKLRSSRNFCPNSWTTIEVEAAVEARRLSRPVPSSIRDMGKVMAELKGRYTGQMDFGKVGPLVKERLCAG